MTRSWRTCVVTPEEFQDRAERAKTSCIISRALGGMGQINLSATLAP
jgi:organic hydroperoxide reductase OsmC/OhrA